MSWQVRQDGLILDNEARRVVGSMVQKIASPEPRIYWRVEIAWSGPGGDIVYETEVHAAALAFIIGVEKAFAAFSQSPGLS